MTNKQEQGKNKKVSVDDLRKALAQKRQTLEFSKREKELTEKIGDKIQEGIEKINPEREYEEDAEYWTLQEEFNKLQNDRKLFELDQNISKLEDVVEQIEIELDEKGE